MQSKLLLDSVDAFAGSGARRDETQSGPFVEQAATPGGKDAKS